MQEAPILTAELQPVLERLARLLESRPLSDRSEPFTVKELAERWHCDEKSVERLCTSGELKSFKVGRKRLVRPVTVARYEKAQAGDES